MQAHGDDVRVLDADEALHLDLHQLRERVAARVGQDADAGGAGHVDDGAGGGGAEEAEEALRHEEGTFDVDLLVRVSGVRRGARGVGAAHEVVPEVVWVDVFEWEDGFTGSGVVDQYVHGIELGLNASVQCFHGIFVLDVDCLCHHLYVRVDLVQLLGRLLETLGVSGDQDDGFGTCFGEGGCESLYFTSEALCSYVSGLLDKGGPTFRPIP